MSYSVLELSFADTRRLFHYAQRGIFGVEFNLKGFDYAWLLASRQWASGERVLDVGAGYSPLPIHIAKEYGSEVWVADDFGMDTDCEFWLRHKDPTDHVQAHPEVRFVLERVGQPEKSTLPRDYFDCIYSISVLEHVPPRMLRAVMKHLDTLLKPGGEMLHAVDIAFPINRGLAHVGLALAFDALYPLVPYRIKERFAFETPRSFFRFGIKCLGITQRTSLKSIGVLRMLLDSEIVLEPMVHTYNRIVKDGFANQKHHRVASLLIHLKKGEEHDA